MADFNSFNEAFTKLEALLTKEARQDKLYKQCPGKSPEQRAELAQMMEIFRNFSTETVEFPETRIYTNYRGYTTISTVISIKGRGQQQIAFDPTNSSDYFTEVRGWLERTYRYNLSDYIPNNKLTNEDIINLKNYLNIVEKEENSVINDLEDLKKRLVFTLMSYTARPDRTEERRTAFYKRQAAIENCRYSLEDLWKKEHPIKEGDDVIYRYNFNGYICGEEKKGKILSITDDGVYRILTQKNRVIERDAEAIGRTSENSYRASAEYKQVREMEERLAG